MLGPAGEHPVRFVGPFGDEIVDEHADVRLRTAEDERPAAQHALRGVDARDDPLRRRFLVAARPVDLAGEIQVFDALGFQRRLQLRRRAIVVFDRVPRPDDLRAFQARHRLHEGKLHVERQTRRNPVHVILARVPALRFEEELVARLVGEFDHLVLDRRAIPRPDALDPPGIHRRPVKVVADDRVSAFVGVGGPAGDLFHVEHAVAPLVEGKKIAWAAFRQAFGPERKRRRRIVARVKFAPREIDRAPVETAGRARLETPNLEAEFAQTVAERAGSIAHPSASLVLLADVQQPAHERPRGHHDRPRAQPDAEVRLDALRAVARGTENQPRGIALVQVEPFLRLAHRLEPELVRLLVTLRTRPAHARSLRRVEHPALDRGGVGVDPHDAAERVDLADHVPLGQSADRRVARHLPDRIEILREHRRLATRARRRQRRLDPGMPRADDEHVVGFWKGEHGCWQCACDKDFHTFHKGRGERPCEECVLGNVALNRTEPAGMPAANTAGACPPHPDWRCAVRILRWPLTR